MDDVDNIYSDAVYINTTGRILPACYQRHRQEKEHGHVKQSDSEQDAEATRLGEDLRRVLSMFVRLVRRETDTPHSAQAETLALLGNGQSMNIAAMARQRQVAHQTMRLIIGQLQAAGLVVCMPDPHDGRSQLFCLSADGHERLAEDRLKRARKISGMIRDDLSGEERAILRQAVGLLERLSVPGR